MIKILKIFNIWDMLDFGQLRCLLELGGFPYLSEFEQTSEMRNSQGTRGTREPPGFLQAAPLRCFFFLPPFYIAGPPGAVEARTATGGSISQRPNGLECRETRGGAG